MNKKSNTVLTGTLTGLLAPPTAFALFCLVALPDESFEQIISDYIRRNVLTHVISLAVLVNLPLFFGFLGSNRDLSARGVIGATFLYAFLILTLKLT